MNFCVLYKVEFFDQIEKKVQIENGLFYANSYKDAMEKVVQFYGEDDISTVTITLMEDLPVILNDYWYERLLKSDELKIL